MDASVADAKAKLTKIVRDEKISIGKDTAIKRFRPAPQNTAGLLIVPLTTKTRNNPYYFLFTHENVKFAVIISQLRLVSTNRFIRRVRKIGKILFTEIKDQIIKKLL